MTSAAPFFLEIACRNSRKIRAVQKAKRHPQRIRCDPCAAEVAVNGRDKPNAVALHAFRWSGRPARELLIAIAEQLITVFCSNPCYGAHQAASAAESRAFSAWNRKVEGDMPNVGSTTSP